MPDSEKPGLSRRTLIGGALALPAGAWLAGCASEDGGGDPATSAASGRPAATGDLRDWREVRGLFDLRADAQHLSVYMFAPHSRPVREAIERHRRGFDEDPRTYLLDNQRLEKEAAQAAARHLSTAVDRIALTDSTTMGLGIFLGGLKLQAGDEIVRSRHEHFAAKGAIDLTAERTGAKVREVELYPPSAPERASVKGIVSALEAAITDRTRVVVVTWVHSANGVRVPLEDIAEMVARRNRSRGDEQRALLVVDAAHALGTGPVDVDELGCDALIAGCHKWLFGPRGTGLVWARPEAWGRISPTIPSWSGWGRDDASPGSGATPGGYHSFEHRWALNEAFALHEQIGADRIAARIGELADRLRAGLREIDSVRLHVPAERRLHSGVVCFTVGRLGAGDAVGRLGERGVIASTTPYEVELARFGTHWINTEDEVDAAIEAVKAIKP